LSANALQLFTSGTAVDDETHALKRCYEDLYILFAWAYRKHIFFPVDLVNKDDQK
jgi:hypothetical protein